MTRALTRTNFNSSQLIRVLADLALVQAADSGGAFAEKLGLWVGFTDAIGLRAAQVAAHESPVDTQPDEKGEAAEAFTRVRDNLVLAINSRESPSGARSRTVLPLPKAGAPYADAIVFEPYRRYYIAHQRDMERQIQSLRANVRNALATASPALRQLADLDAAFDTILSERESKLLSTLPKLLEQRFRQLLEEHQLAQAGSNEADNPDLWMKPDGWLARFCNELQTVLIAELDLRLQPSEGLIEALHNTLKVTHE